MKSTLKHIEHKIKIISDHPGFRKYFFNTGWMFAEKILRLVAGLFIGAYVARYLGPAQYGLMNYVISLVSLFSVVTLLGLDSIVIKALVEDESRRNQLLGTAFVLKFAAVAIMFIGFLAGAQLVETENTTQYLIYVIAAGSIFEVFGVIGFFFDSQAQSKYIVWSQMSALVIISLVRIILVLSKASLIWFAAIFTLDFFVLATGLIYFYSRNIGKISGWKFNRDVAREMLTQSWPLIIAAMSVTVYMKIDQVMVRWMLGDEANGNYGVAVRLSELWNFIPIAVCGSVFPAILNAKRISVQLYNSRLQWLYDLMVGISLIIAIPMTFLSDFIVTLLFGNAYHDAGDVLSLYIWSAVFVFLGVANGKWIVSENLQQFRMVSFMLAALLNVILNLILIRWMGINGAAVRYINIVFNGFLF